MSANYRQLDAAEALLTVNKQEAVFLHELFGQLRKDIADRDKLIRKLQADLDVYRRARGDTRG